MNGKGARTPDTPPGGQMRGEFTRGFRQRSNSMGMILRASKGRQAGALGARHLPLARPESTA